MDDKVNFRRGNLGANHYGEIRRFSVCVPDRCGHSAFAAISDNRRDYEGEKKRVDQWKNKRLGIIEVFILLQHFFFSATSLLLLPANNLKWGTRVCGTKYPRNPEYSLY